jgi:hypothetical protein
MATSGEIRWPPAGRNDGHQWGIKWPPVGRNRWPLTPRFDKALQIVEVTARRAHEPRVSRDACQVSTDLSTINCYACVTRGQKRISRRRWSTIAICAGLAVEGGGADVEAVWRSTG